MMVVLCALFAPVSVQVKEVFFTEIQLNTAAPVPLFRRAVGKWSSANLHLITKDKR